MSGSKEFDKLLEKTTSSLLLDTDWESNLKICDLIRQGDVQGKYVIAQLKKKLNHANVNTVLFALQCVESMVKNCGSKIHQEVATKDFMDQMRAIALVKSDPIKAKILELIQCWAHAFKKNPNYKVVEDYFNSMKLEGFLFSKLKESEAMFDVEEAPAWKEDAECLNCFRCRAEFSTLKRRHHCRACGQIFCHACSSKVASIPKFGIEKEVRVCDLCYDKLKGNQTTNAALLAAGGQSSDQLPIEYINSSLYKEAVASSASSANAAKKSTEKTEQEFEEELQLALALSQSEAEAAEQKRKQKDSNSKQTTSEKKSENKLFPNNLNQIKNEFDNQQSDQTVKQLINKSKQFQQDGDQMSSYSASAPYLENTKTNKSDDIIENQDKISSAAEEEEKRISKEIDEFVDEVKKLLEIYINRMKSDSMRGRSITNDTAVQSLFLQLQHLHPRLMSYLKYYEDARGYYENLQDKLTQLKDAREALNALRQENFEKKKRENEERERLRQIQIAQKLQYMRQQKQSYYQYQNQLNLQNLQLQERDLQMRLEQQRQLVMKRDQQLLSSIPFQAIPNENFSDYSQMQYSMQQQHQIDNSGQMINMPKSLSNNSMNLNLNQNTSLPPHLNLNQNTSLPPHLMNLIQSNNYNNLQISEQVQIPNLSMQHMYSNQQTTLSYPQENSNNLPQMNINSQMYTQHMMNIQQQQILQNQINPTIQNQIMTNQMQGLPNQATTVPNQMSNLPNQMPGVPNQTMTNQIQGNQTAAMPNQMQAMANIMPQLSSQMQLPLGQVPGMIDQSMIYANQYQYQQPPVLTKTNEAQLISFD